MKTGSTSGPLAPTNCPYPPGPTYSSISAIANIPNAPNAYFQVATDGTVYEMLNGCAQQVENPIPGLVGPISGAVVTSDGYTLYLWGTDGGVFMYSTINRFYGSMAGHTLGGQIVSLVPTLDFGGYLLIGADGGVFSFGDAPFYGNLVGRTLNPPSPVGTPYDVIGAFFFSGQQYYCLAEADGYYNCFGGGGVFGRAQEVAISSIYTNPATTIMTTGDTWGWWWITRQGQIYAFGDATYQGGLSSVPWGPILGGSGWGTGGYRFVGTDGSTYNFGSLAAYWEGNAPWTLNPSGNSAGEVPDQQIAQVMLPEGNWGTPNQWSNGLQPIWQNESGWRWYVCGGYPNGPYYPSCPYTTNAYGIPQSLPGSKMCTQGPACPTSTAWQTNPWTQMMWGFWYIAVNPNGECCPHFYDPITAWQYWQSHLNYSPTA